MLYFPNYIHVQFSFILICTACLHMVNTHPCGKRNNSKQLNNPFLTRKSNSEKDGNNESDTTKKGRKPCCPYDFDSSFCREVDDRVLCGYDRNVGKPQSKNLMESVSGGCRSRGDRLECGYVEGPFDTIRRPPVWDNDPIQIKIDEENQSNEILSKVEMLKGPNNFKVLSTNQPKRATRCMETAGNRIVCRRV